MAADESGRAAGDDLQPGYQLGRDDIDIHVARRIGRGGAATIDKQ